MNYQGCDVNREYLYTIIRPIDKKKVLINLQKDHGTTHIG